MIGCKPETSLLSVNFHSGLKLHGNRKNSRRKLKTPRAADYITCLALNAIEHVSIRICVKQFELSNQIQNCKVTKALHAGK